MDKGKVKSKKVRDISHFTFIRGGIAVKVFLFFDIVSIHLRCEACLLAVFPSLFHVILITIKWDFILKLHASHDHV